MLNVQYFNSLDEVDWDKLPSHLLIVCPDPKTADNARNFWGGEFEVTTIASWIKKYQNENLTRLGKAELMLKLASAWRIYFKEAPNHLFYNAFELFTELRSFTLDISIIEDLLIEFDADLIKSVKIFFAVFDAENIVDEQKSYALMKDSKLKEPLLVWGFKHLNSNQIDMFKSLSHNNDVYFYIPSAVKARAKNTDWINWLEVSERLSFEIKKPRVSIIEVAEKKITNELKELSVSEGIEQLAFISKNSEWGEVQEVLIRDFNLKIPISFLETKIKEIWNILEVAQDFDVSLKEMINESLCTFDYRKLKVLQMIEEAVTLYRQYSSEIDSFTLSVLKAVVELNQPRTYGVTLLEKGQDIIDYQNFSYYQNQKKTCIVLDAKTVFSSAGQLKYSAELYKKLSGLGPIKSNELELNYFIYELNQFLNINPSVMLITRGQLEQNIHLREFLKNCEFDLLKSKLNVQLKNKNDPLDLLIDKNQKKQKKLSASRLQVFLDCPRKYYFEYELKLKIEDDVENKISPRDLGNLEHRIIKEYFENNIAYSEKEHTALALSQLNLFLKENKKRISLVDLEKYKTEVIFNSGIGIKYLYSKKNELSIVEVLFEKELSLNEYGIRGRIDALLKTENGVALVDFKRSSYGTGTSASIKKFEKIQLWIYSLIESNSNVEWFSYLNLSEDEENEVKIQIDNDDVLSSFKLFLAGLIDQFNLEQKYYPNPKTDKTCSFCSVEKICSKGAL